MVQSGGRVAPRDAGPVPPGNGICGMSRTGRMGRAGRVLLPDGHDALVMDGTRTCDEVVDEILGALRDRLRAGS